MFDLAKQVCRPDFDKKSHGKQSHIAEEIETQFTALIHDYK